MQAKEAQLLAFLKQSPQFVIPIYQRIYSWTKRECQQLWDDIIRTGSDDEIPAHFIGSIVYISKGLSPVTHQAPLLVIDGQQRLTTVILLLAALEDTEPVDGFSAKKLRNYYLLNPQEDGERHYKLIPSQTDKKSLISIINGYDLPADHSLRVVENYKMFEGLIADRQGDLSAVCKGLAKLFVVDIMLSRDHDNPQLIFESMNSTGRALSQADLIRNFILMGLETQQQTHLYEKFWRPMEISFGQEAYNIHFDSFVRHYLTVKTGEIPRKGDVYEAFKAHARSPKIAQGNIETLVKDIREFATYYCAMALGAESDKFLKDAFQDLRELKADVAYPFLLELYHDYVKGFLPRDDFVEVVRLIESYVFRRSVCEIPTNALSKVFAAFSKDVNRDRYLESVKAHFLLMQSYRRFPRDSEFKRDIQDRDLYTFRNRSYWLRRFENYERNERVLVDEYTIEHIMPQSEGLSNEWKIDLGENWKDIHQNYLHTLGNLTLTGYNSEYGSRSFKEKRDMDGGFKHSPLRVNAGLGDIDEWNEEAIKSRALRLAEQAIEVWCEPNLPEDILDNYRLQTTTTGYSIENHQQLLKSPTREIFNEFRREVRKLDPCVSEEFLKHYVAYKAETNFVDIDPRAEGLLLILNIGFSEIRDSRNICRDVSEIGHHGNGDVEVKLSNLDELPYVIGLVRQSLERQLGDEGDT